MIEDQSCTPEMRIASPREDSEVMPPNDGITVDEAALLVGCTVSDVHYRIGRGKIRKIASTAKPMLVSKTDVLAEAANPTIRRKERRTKTNRADQPISARTTDTRTITPPQIQSDILTPAEEMSPNAPRLPTLVPRVASNDFSHQPEIDALRTPLRDLPLSAEETETLLPTEILVSTISLDASLRVRADVNPQVAEDYAAQMREGHIFPPADLFSGDDEYYIGDGWYRLEAARLAGQESFPAYVRGTGKTAALRWALSSNTAHGQPLTNADKRRKVLLALEEYPDRSGNEIARICAVSESMVRNFQNTFAPNEPAEKRIGADGKRYPARRAAAAKPARSSAEKCYFTVLKHAERLEIAALRRLVEAIEQLIASRLATSATTPTPAAESTATTTSDIPASSTSA